ncbi:MAG TPA: hypothetical protein VF629_03805 [Hymenobacter sp.]|uniref:hypothetical protein n=1 Tax=Hymenobacter sp. TaxID=1898978 RepID=UPI002EDAFB15
MSDTPKLEELLEQILLNQDAIDNRLHNLQSTLFRISTDQEKFYRELRVMASDLKRVKNALKLPLPPPSSSATPPIPAPGISPAPDQETSQAPAEAEALPPNHPPPARPWQSPTRAPEAGAAAAALPGRLRRAQPGAGTESGPHRRAR